MQIVVLCLGYVSVTHEVKSQVQFVKDIGMHPVEFQTMVSDVHLHWIFRLLHSLPLIHVLILSIKMLIATGLQLKLYLTPSVSELRFSSIVDQKDTLIDFENQENHLVIWTQIC